ncbi:unnamed protein product [Cladocopium goreaui]|uniref:Uncharacterized protein n=1 Tax=Cladocopium goreaui TaxID=2562237 RepID=A0A9P1FXX0_9DINO|nr:unnamed protein product [Cladocopium goreaui]
MCQPAPSPATQRWVASLPPRGGSRRPLGSSRWFLRRQCPPTNRLTSRWCGAFARPRPSPCWVRTLNAGPMIRTSR